MFHTPHLPLVFVGFSGVELLSTVVVVHGMPPLLLLLPAYGRANLTIHPVIARNLPSPSLSVGCIIQAVEIIVGLLRELGLLGWFLGRTSLQGGSGGAVGRDALAGQRVSLLNEKPR